MRLKHGHFCNIALEASGVPPNSPRVERPCFHLSLDKHATVPAAEPNGHERLQDLIRAHDAGEALPDEALTRLIDALRVFAGTEAIEHQLKQFALQAGLSAGDEDAAEGPPSRRLTRPLRSTSHAGTTTLEAVRNLHCRTLHVQASMTKLGAALRETMGIVVQMRSAANARAQAQGRSKGAAGESAVAEDERQLAGAFG